MRAIFRSVLLFLLFFPLSEVEGQSIADVSDVRTGTHAEKTRLVIELNKKINYKIFSLSQPNRIVLDLPEVTFGEELGRKKTLGLINALRFGLFKPGNSRIVLDVKQSVRVEKSFIMWPSGKHAFRLVIDLVPTSQKDFDANIRTKKKKPTTVRKEITTKKKIVGEKPLVIIDPGHGGVDPGTIGLSGVYEKRITLSFAEQLKQKLLNGGRYRVKLTRERDVFVKLRSRIDFAREHGGDLFLSIHADSIKDRTFSGSGVYTLSENASDKEAAALASKENKADVIAGVDLDHHDAEVATILIDLTQRETMNYAASFAEALVRRLREEGRMRRKPHRFAGFLVLKAPDIPSVLVEIGYLSNRKEEKLLKSAKKRQGIVDALAKGVDDYFKQLEN